MALIEDSVRECQLDVARSKRLNKASDLQVETKIISRNSSLRNAFSSIQEKLKADTGVGSTINFDNMSRRYTSPFRRPGFEEEDLLELKEFQETQSRAFAASVADEERNMNKIYSSNNRITQDQESIPAPQNNDTINVARVLRPQELASMSSVIKEEGSADGVRT